MLTRLGATNVSGTDPALGAWDGYTIQYAAGDASATPFTVTFRAFANSFEFEQVLPSGAHGLNLSVPVNTTSARRLGEFGSSQTPSTLFPNFAAAASPAELAHLTWTGRFCAPASGSGAWAALAGAEGGPRVIFNSSDVGVARSALVLSAANHFHGAFLGSAAAGAAAGVGVNGYVVDAPAAHAIKTALVFSTDGLTDAVMQWGATMQTMYATRKVHDPSSAALTYWTGEMEHGSTRRAHDAVAHSPLTPTPYAHHAPFHRQWW
jgi:hypothetical protein